MKAPFLMALLLLPLASGGSPWFINELDAQVSFQGEIEVDRQSDSLLNWVEASFYLTPQQSALQGSELLSVTPKTYEIETDKEGNRFVTFRWNKPSKNILPYSLKWKVNVSRLKYAIINPGNLSKKNLQDRYLEIDNLTYWTGYMREKADSITKGSSSTIEAVRRISDWITQTLEYDKSCWQDTLPAEWVFAENRGVCDEFTNLFISMCRSIGIPARYVEGLVYSGDEWNFHAWAEVYAGSWIPVDPTYNEVGFVDSSHIVLARMKTDADIYNSLSWEGRNVDVNFGEDDFSVKIIDSRSLSLFDSEFEMQAEASGSERLNASLSLKSITNSYTVATCSINMPLQMRILDNAEKSITLRPREETALDWEIATPSDLDTNYIHRMPVEVRCFPGSNHTKELTVRPRTEEPMFGRAAITDLTIKNKTNVEIRFKNSGTKELSEVIVSLCVSENCSNQTYSGLEPGEEDTVFFKDMQVKESQKVSAALYSEEFGRSSTETILSNLQNPDLPGKKSQDVLGVFEDLQTESRLESSPLLMASILFVILMMAFAIIFSLKTA
jgi:hypothetical protein